MPTDPTELERLMEAASAQAVDAIAIVTAEANFLHSKIVYVNDACCKLLRCEREALLGCSRLALAGGRPTPDLLDRVRAEAAAADQPFFGHVTRLRRDGSQYDVEGHVAPLRDERGHVTHYVITQHEVTARNRAERELRSALLLAERMRATADLAAGTVYGLRDPISRALASLDLAKAVLGAHACPSDVDGRVSGAVADASAACTSLRDVVSDLGALALDPGPTEPVDVEAALDLAVDLTAFELAPRAHVERSRRPLPRVSANFGRLVHVLTCILRNAAQAIPGDQPANNWVRICTDVEDGRVVVVEIADSGEGIEPGDLPHVFEPFFTSRAGPASSGLGLSVAQATIAALGGEVTIASEVGRGTRVRVTLPACDEVSVPHRRSRPAFAQQQMVLVVADDPATYPTFARMLDNHRTVVSFATPDEALERVALGEAIDLVVIDRALRWKAELGFREELEALAPHMRPRVLELSTRSATRPRALDASTRTEL
ncbi:MAG: ATP-binding protein [Polyangiaceae bacterium]